MAFILDQGTPHDLNEDWQGHCCAWNPTIPAHIPSSTIGTLESIALPLSVFRADLGDTRLPSSRLSSGSLSWTFDQRGTEAGQRWSTVKFKTTDLHRDWNETLVFQKTPGIFHSTQLLWLRRWFLKPSQKIHSVFFGNTWRAPTNTGHGFP